MKNTDCTDKRKKGQALLELAVFGSILIMLLGILINYGLRYNFQQEVMQHAFRKALKSAAEADQGGKPASVTNILVKDRYIPNPSSPFAVGSVIPVSASASVVRNYHMQDNVPETYAELPEMSVNIQGQEASFKTAGFRDERNVAEDAINKYKEIYGSSNVWVTGDGECLEEEMDETTGESICIRPTKNLRIIDSSAGEIVNYDAALKQCRQIVDREACQKECERGKFPGSETDCNTTCSQPMNVPWYCEDYIRTQNPAGSMYTYNYTFPVLNSLFNFAIADNRPKNMGLQQDYAQETRVEAGLNKTETESGIQTTDVADYKDTMQRKVIYNAGLDNAGVSKGEAHIIQYPVNTTTQLITCEKNSTDCVYGYKIVTCSGDDCGQSAGEKTWQTNW